MGYVRSRCLTLAASVLLTGCGSEAERSDPPTEQDVHALSGGCFAVEGIQGRSAPLYLAATEAGDGFAFAATSAEEASRFTLRAADLGTYLLFDQGGRYFAAEQQSNGLVRFDRPAQLDSELTVLVDGYRSSAEWAVEPSLVDDRRFQLRHVQTGRYLTRRGLTDNPLQAAVITMISQEGCATFPELSLDAEGEVIPRSWPDGDLWGIAEIHSHMFHNRGFGGGSTFHGAPFHRLGVEHALPDCSPWHGPDGRRDVVGFFLAGNTSEFDIDQLAGILSNGEIDGFNHETAGYPDFTTWPNSWGSETHQTMYYRWIERAYLGGLRLIVQHATGQSVLCELVSGIGAQTPLHDCNDMVNVDREIEAAHALERYIDAQAGGPGEGWLRIVTSPAEAREVIGEGKLAMVLGIEISNLFDCFLTAREGFEPCTEQSVEAKIEEYRDKGVRAIFPVHKFDNAFTAGDGDAGVIELGNLINTGHYSSFVEDCPGLQSSFDGGDVTFGGLNQPRDDYGAPPPFDTSRFAEIPFATLLPFLDAIQEPPLEGNYCQKHGLTSLGEHLMMELMKHGMIIDIAHLPQRSMLRAYEMLEARDYPATKTHGSSNEGRLYDLGGMTGTGLGRCAVPGEPGSMGRALRESVALRESRGAYPAEALAFDLNGFAGGPRPRFGEDSPCNEPQSNPVTYPFDSYDGEVTFTEPQLGNRSVDFNTEGMIHIGLLPELIEDARRDGVTDAELAPLFRSAEAYIRLWEKAEARGAALADE